MTNALSPAEVASALAVSMGNLSRELIGTEPTSRTGMEWRWRAKGSLAVHVAGPKQGRFYDNEAGVYGDALALVAHLRGCSMRDAYHWSLAWLGNPIASPAPARPTDKERKSATSAQPEADADKLRLPLRLWAEAQRAAGSPVERYLAGRGLELPLDAPLRFHPACPRGADRLPAMVALMTHPAEREEDGSPRIVGIHRTFLLPGGTGKALGQAKMMLGAAGVVRLVPDAEVTMAVGIAEGIETSLAIMQRQGWAPVWAAGSAGGIASFPVLPGIEALTIFPDADDGGASRAAAHRCAGRWHASGRQVRFGTPPAGTDFADLAGRAA
jgi:hypothetical protein